MAKPIDTAKLYIHAESFRLSCELLEAEIKQGKDIYLFAYYANDSFCCELFLKCLATIQTGKHPRGHKLDDLFSVLPTKDQDRVEELYEELSKSDIAHKGAAKVSPSKSNSLRNVLKDGRDVFEAIRYWYEGTFTHRRGVFRWPIAALRARILEIHPHWPNRPERWKEPKSAKHQKPSPSPLGGSILPAHIAVPVAPLIAVRARRKK